jgi:hypothetical protein
MPRRFRRSSRRFGRPVKTVSYNNQTVHAINHLEWDGNIDHVPRCWYKLIGNLAVGDCKVKNFSLKIQSGIFPVPVVFALVYLPSVMTVEALDLSQGVPAEPVQLYNPAQNVIMSGILPHGNTGLMNFHSRLARNLEPHDKICLVMKAIQGTADGQNFVANIDVSLNYVVTMQ